MQQELLQLIDKLKKEKDYNWVSQKEILDEAVKLFQVGLPSLNRALIDLRKNNDLQFCIIGSNVETIKKIKCKENNCILSGVYNIVLKKIKRDDILQKIKLSQEKHIASMFTRYTFFYKIR